MKKLQFLSILLVVFVTVSCTTHYEVASVQRSRILIDKTYDNKVDERAASFIAPYKHQVDSIMSPVVGHLSEYMSAQKPESLLSNLLTDVLIWAAKDYNEKPEFAVYNMGGIRAALSEGTVTYGDVLDVAPFENKIAFFDMKGTAVRKLFEQIANNMGEGVSHGVELVIGRNGSLISAKLNGEEINPEKTYRVASIDYLAQGNDGLTAFKEKTNVNSPQETSNNLRFLIMNYFREMDKKGEVVTAKVEGRITIDPNSAAREDGLGTSKKDYKKPSITVYDADVTKRIQILHTNDTHSCVYPLNVNLADTLLAGRGGFLRRLNMINEERAKNPKLLLLDSGDFSQGSTYYTLFKGDVEVELMNLMGYDCGTIGNHEFDYGLENMVRLFKKANFPIVCANYDFTGTIAEGVVKPYTIIKRDGVKIGIFGLSPELDGLVSAQNYEGVKYLDPVKVANEVADKLKNIENCDVVICLSHLGWGIVEPIDDEALIKQTRNIDIVLGGHSHSYFEDLYYVTNAEGAAIPVDQNGKHGLFVGNIFLNINKK